MSTGQGQDPRAGHGERPPAPDPLPLPVVDNHTHLDIAREGDLTEVGEALAAARAVGVDRVVQIGCDLEAARWTERVVESPAVIGGVALHPNEIPALAASGRLEAALAEIERIHAHPRIRVVGETGLDYYRTDTPGQGVQRDAFRWHIDLAKRLGKPLQIHDRDAHEDVLTVLDEVGAPDVTVMHCFSGDVAFARECVERGFYLSFSGTITFKNAHALRDALAVVPLDQVLVETDAPYLTPHPYRGATNGPYLMPLTVRQVARTLAVDVPAVCAATSATSERLYGPWAQTR